MHFDGFNALGILHVILGAGPEMSDCSDKIKRNASDK